MSVDARVRAPSASQYERLLHLAVGTVGLTWTEGQARSLLEHGWVSFDPKDGPWSWVRLTPAGFHALAAGVVAHGVDRPVPVLVRP